VLRVEAESTAALASTHEEVGSLFQKIATLEGELVMARRAREVFEENSCGLSHAAAIAEQRCEESERGHQE
jgi:hypothetical protein